MTAKIPMPSTRCGAQALEDLKARERRSDFERGGRGVLRAAPALHRAGRQALCALGKGDLWQGHRMQRLSRWLRQRGSTACWPGLETPKGERFLRFTVTKGRKEWRERFNYDVGALLLGDVSGPQGAHGLKVEWKVERMGAGNLARSALRLRGVLRQGEGASRRQASRPRFLACRTLASRSSSMWRLSSAWATRDSPGQDPAPVELPPRVDRPVDGRRHAPTARKRARSAAPKSRAA